MIEPNDPRFVSTVTAIERELLRGKHVMRYMNEDDFGMPEAAFLDLPLLADRRLVVARSRAKRRAISSSTLSRIATDTDFWRRTFIPKPDRLWGNFPQTYSMAGLILTAMRLSRSWEDRYWRG